MEECNTEDKSAAIGATLRLLQLTCNIQEERTKCNIIYSKRTDYHEIIYLSFDKIITKAQKIMVTD